MRQVWRRGHFGGFLRHKRVGAWRKQKAVVEKKGAGGMCNVPPGCQTLSDKMNIPLMRMVL